MIYRVDYINYMHGHSGYSYHGSKAAAERAARKYKDQTEDQSEITSVPTPRTKQETIALLNQWAAHNDNG